MRYRVEHSKIKFTSTHGHVIFSKCICKSSSRGKRIQVYICKIDEQTLLNELLVFMFSVHRMKQRLVDCNGSDIRSWKVGKKNPFKEFGTLKINRVNTGLYKVKKTSVISVSNRIRPDWSRS